MRKAFRGTTLIEVVVSLGILSIGVGPIFFLLGETRRVTTSSIYELQATGMASSMIGGLVRAPWSSLKLIIGQELSDEEFPAFLSPTKLGIPKCYAGLSRKTEIKIVNQPQMPQDRIKNPWGRVAEIRVTVESLPPSSVNSAMPKKVKKILTVKGYRLLEDSET
ncbi:MAG: prepilin-type N-terminal cleavage/methylation domain-containing protein [Candidatus Ozemobacteraceae bacterium]